MAICIIYTVFSAVLFFTASSTVCKVTPRYVYSTIGSTVDLTCILTVERMYLTWLGPPNLTTYAIGSETDIKQDSRIRITGNEQKDQHILRITKMQENNEGLYKCTSIKGEECFLLLIQRPPRNISISKSDNRSFVYGVANQQLNLTCNVQTGKPPERMQWMYENDVVATGGPGSLTYSFIPDFVNHFKQFRCVVVNNFTRTVLTETVMLYLCIEPIVKIMTDRIVNIREDDTLLLECNYTSNDNRDITFIIWKYTLNYEIKYLQANKTLELDNTKRTNAGEYTCIVSNSAGEANDTVTVNVLYSPAIYITLEDKKNDKVLKCNANGNPDDYEFSAWEHRTEYGDHIRFLNDSGNGHIKLHHTSGETERHHDQGIYICSVSNGVPYDGKMNQLANYTLRQKGLLYVVNTNKEIQYGLLGMDHNLTLNVVSYPIIKTVTIYKHHQKETTDVHYETELTKIEDVMYGKKVNIQGYKVRVPIKIAVQEDFMIYTIVVTNDYGQTTTSVDFKPARPPSAPNNIRAVALDNMILIKWTGDFSVELQITFFLEYRKHFETLWNTVSVEDKSSIVLTGLEFDTIYLLRIYSKTMAGESNTTDDILIKTEKQPPKMQMIAAKFSLMFGAVLFMSFLFWCGFKALKKRQQFCRHIHWGKESHRNEEPPLRPAHYDEIDSMYYNPINAAISHQVTTNVQLEIHKALHANFEDNEANSSSSQTVLPSTVNQFELSEKTNSQRSSSDESYLVPCRSYIDFDIEMVNADKQPQDIGIEEPNIKEDASSISSNNSETNIKVIRRYETLNVSDTNEHCYKKIQ